MWSKCPCVASTATGRRPSSSSIRCTAAGEKPGSTTTASSVPSAPISQQFVSNELSEKTSRYIGRPSYRTRCRGSERGRVDPQRDGAVVQQLDLHVLAERSPLHRGPLRLEGPGEGL